jgi:hypothetical protein
METHEQVLEAFRRGVPIMDLYDHTPKLQRIRAEREELYRLAIPLYRADYEGHLWCRDKDDRYWKARIGSAYVLAQERVAAHLAGLPWPPQA